MFHSSFRGNSRLCLAGAWAGLATVLVLVGADVASAAIPNDEAAALQALFTATDGVNWTDNSGWNGPAGTECQWFGVACDAGENHVTSIMMPSNGLIGVIPDEFWDLTELRQIRLNNNGLQGPLSPDIGQLTQLNTVNFELNALTGPLPVELGSASSLEQVLLSGNGFTGSIPTELGNLPNLQRLLLGGNQLSGSIPAELAMAGNLTSLSLSGNQLTGTIPDLSALDLQGIGLNNNDLEGPFPSWLLSMPDLVAIRMSGNRLSGPIPGPFSALTQLMALDLNNNLLTGSVPDSLGDLQSLEFVGLSGNMLTGSIPASLGNAKALKILDLSFNQLSGSMPSALGKLPQLEQMNLGSNQLTGTIPGAFRDLVNLRILALFNNRLSGTIPVDLADLSLLEQLSLSGNQLSGTIPDELTDLAALRILQLSNNQLTGSIPLGISNQSSLEFVFLSNNQLSGSIPDLSALVDLRDLRLQNNQLSGSIPPLWDPLDQLTRLDLSFNQLTGSLPLEIGGLSALKNLLVTANQLSGPIPPTLGDLTQVEEIQLALNSLEGEIPPELDQLGALQVLNLIHNRLDGEVPFLGNLTALDSLYLSSNGLTGIDPGLSALTQLQDLRVELNRLSTDNAGLALFLDTLQSQWRETQTVAPENLTAQASSFASVTVGWDPILYQAQAGGYRVSYGTTAGGPYPFFAGITANKSVSGLEVTGLEPETTYYFVVQTQTQAHAGNQRTLVSPLSDEVSATTPSEDLLAHWPLNETAGMVAFDASGHGNDGTVLDAPSRVAGQVAGAYDFDGVDDYIKVDDPGVWDLDLSQAMTLALWLRADRVDRRQMLISKDNVFELEVGAVQGQKDYVSLRFDNSFTAVADSPLTVSKWHHVAAAWDGATIRFFIDGVAAGSSPFAGPLVNNNDLDIGLAARAPDLIPAVLFFDGAMDDVRIYNRALTAAEVTALADDLIDVEPPDVSTPLPAANLPLGTTAAILSVDTDEAAVCRFGTVPGLPFEQMGSTLAITGGTAHSTPLSGLVDDQIYSYFVRCRDSLGNAGAVDTEVHFAVAQSDVTTGLLADWTMDEGAGCTAADTTGSRDGTLGGDCVGANVPQWITGRVSHGLRFDGDDRVEAAGTGSLSAVSLSAWVRMDSTTGFMALIDQRQSGVDGFNLFVEPGGRLFMRVNDHTVVGDTVITDGAWHWVAATFDGVDQVLYVDGFEDKREPAGPSLIDTAGAVLQLGSHYSDPQFSYQGDLDEVRLYDRALTPFDALELFIATP